MSPVDTGLQARRNGGGRMRRRILLCIFFAHAPAYSTF